MVASIFQSGCKMTDDERAIVRQAFLNIEDAIIHVELSGDIDQALQDIFDAVNQIAPGLSDEVANLTTAEIGNVLVNFYQRADRATDDEPGNSPEQTFLAMVVVGEMKRRANQDGIAVLEWCRRERIRGFINE